MWNSKVSYWSIPAILLVTLILFNEDVIVKKLKLSSIGVPSALMTVVLTIIIIIFISLNFMRKPEFSYKTHYTIAIIELVIFTPILFFLGMIAIHYYPDLGGGSRHSLQVWPWVGISLLFLNYGSASKRYMIYKIKLRNKKLLEERELVCPKSSKIKKKKKK